MLNVEAMIRKVCK
ncbi:hypothetical protein fHeYen901_259 [Yersinia phage fHe-Yen9-01]|uniref:Uncharacterized protein n=1 Tax=Yersinia phage fHe-Yen9-01 TaxID=1965363 RepID=A0A1V0DXZ7_9CAUD|nr:hypothetical protein KNT60_gp258 [Yersinia phage fHe-Yen9-01]ARB06032.1 hypothetical protein fHeYen901_259 [Yersinia phage fHe-Yen9-01]